MKLFKFLHTPKFSEEDRLRAKNCLNTIATAVSEKRGIPEFIHNEDGSVAFAGSREKMELVLELSIQRADNKNWLSASLDDEVSWQEWDYVNQAEFEQSIIDHLANRVNRTVKTVTETVKHKSYRQAFYYRDNAGSDWILFEEYALSNNPFCRVVARRTETIETIKTYQLDLR